MESNHARLKNAFTERLLHQQLILPDFGSLLRIRTSNSRINSALPLPIGPLGNELGIDSEFYRRQFKDLRSANLLSSTALTHDAGRFSATMLTCRKTFHIVLVTVEGIEPSSQGSKPRTLPLSYTEMLATLTRIELATDT